MIIVVGCRRIPGMKVGGGLSDTLADFSSIQVM